MSFNILVINPGSTSTKIAIYEDENQVFTKNIVHDSTTLSVYHSIADQYDMRRTCVIHAVEESGYRLAALSAVVGRGGMLRSLKAGGYLVNQEMVYTLLTSAPPTHESNLGAPIAHSIAQPLGIPAYIYDAVSADELLDVARITGIPEIRRESFCHVLNSKATARKIAGQLGGTYEAMNFIVAHIGGGISISAHKKGHIIDVITDDAGPFSPERSGSVPLNYFLNMCYHNGYSEKELLEKLKKNSGIKGHLGTHDCVEVERRIADGDETAYMVYEAQAYQIAKGIGEMAPPLHGEVDAVILTGGLAYSEYITQRVEQRVRYLGKVFTVPGENEMEALAFGALRILNGEEGYHVWESHSESDAAPAGGRRNRHVSAK